MKTITRLSYLKKPLVSRNFSTTRTAMAKLDLNSKYKMLSGYEIPVLGYGVSLHSQFIISLVF
jgi:hypothetical protein